MRKYIRHPISIPISFRLDDSPCPTDNDVTSDLYNSKQRGYESAHKAEEYHLKDVSDAGLCFLSQRRFKCDTSIEISIPVQVPPFQASGTVVWCRPLGDRYAIGVLFSDSSTLYGLRMVEQVCHIEDYRKRIHREQGRELSAEQAAMEWIEYFAANFP